MEPVKKKVVKPPRKNAPLPKSGHYYKDFDLNVFKKHQHLSKVIALDEEDLKRFLCLVCQEFTGKKTSGYFNHLLGHLKSKSHQNCTLQKGNDESLFLKEIILTLETEEETESSEKDNKTKNQDEEMPAQPISKENGDKVKLLFHYAKFFLENRLPFSFITNLLEFVKDLIKTYPLSLIQEFSTSRTTLTDVTGKCIGECIREQIFEDLNRNFFSISVDGGSDKFGAAFFTVCVRYFEDEMSDYPATKFIAMFPVQDSSTGEVLYEKLKKGLLEHPKFPNIAKNLIGITSDQGSNMSGSEQGLCSRLLRDYPYAVSINDFSHLYHLIFKHALKSFPGEVLSLVKDICSHFGRSIQRKNKLLSIQEKLKMKPILKPPKYTPVRWLSFREALERILKLWEPLKIYFDENKDEKMKKSVFQPRITFI